MRTLFIVDTPSQVYNIIDAIAVYRIDNYDVIINDCNRADTYQQLQARLVELNPTQLFEVPRVEGKISDRIEAYGKFIKTFIQTGYKNVFFSAIRQQWQRDIVCTLQAENTVLMDDGNATVIFYEYLFTHRKFFDFPYDSDDDRRQLALQTRKKLGIETKELPSLSLFTMFNLASLPWLSVVKNPLLHLQRPHKKLNQNQAFILGVGAVTVGYITLEKYVALIARTAEEFPGKSIIYVPHRIESDLLLSKIEALGIAVKRFNKPIENELAEREEVPATIVSYHTTALFTCARMFPHIDVVCVQPLMTTWEDAADSHVWNFTACNNLQGLETVYKYIDKEPSIRTIKLADSIR